MDAQRKRLSVSNVAPRTGPGAGSLEDEAVADAFPGLKDSKVVWISSKTDAEAKKKRSFGEKSEVCAFHNLDEAEKAEIVKTVFWTCRKGLKPESPNQDSFTLLIAVGEFSVYGVFDGHGPFGHDVSHFAHKCLMKAFVNSPDRDTDTEAAFKAAFIETQEQIVQASKDKKLQAESSGTTCTMVYHNLQNNSITTAHVGDSRGALRSDKTPRALTRDHKPNLEDEKQRIERAGGRVIFDGYYNHRVFASDGMYPGLNMSRVFGDIKGHEKAGLTAEPECATISLPSGANTLLVCSDGVWEFLDEPAAFTTLKDDPDAASVTALAESSWNKWMEDSDHEISDDITVIAVKL